MRVFFDRGRGAEGLRFSSGDQYHAQGEVSALLVVEFGGVDVQQGHYPVMPVQPVEKLPMAGDLSADIDFRVAADDDGGAAGIAHTRQRVGDHDVIERLERIPEITIDLGQAAERRVGEHRIEGAVEPVRERNRCIQVMYRPEGLGFQVIKPHRVDFIDDAHFLRVEDGQQAVSGRRLEHAFCVAVVGKPAGQPGNRRAGAVLLEHLFVAVEAGVCGLNASVEVHHGLKSAGFVLLENVGAHQFPVPVYPAEFRQFVRCRSFWVQKSRCHMSI